jgi:hypothetical protein
MDLDVIVEKSRVLEGEEIIEEYGIIYFVYIFFKINNLEISSGVG